MNKQLVTQLCNELQKIHSELKAIKLNERKILDEFEGDTRDHRRQLTDVVYLTNAEQHIQSSLTYLNDLR